MGSARQIRYKPARLRQQLSSATGSPRQQPRTVSCLGRAREKSDRIARARGGVACAAKGYARPPPTGVHMIGVLAVSMRLLLPSQEATPPSSLVGPLVCWSASWVEALRHAYSDTRATIRCRTSGFVTNC